MKKISIIYLLCIILGCVACETNQPKPPVVVTVKAISLNPTNISLNQGDFQTIQVTLEPADADVSRIEWTSSNERVVTVKDGTITALRYGKTTVKAVVDGLTSSVSVTVSEADRRYELAWEDDFNESALNESNWNFEIGPARNNEKQYYKKENATISGGILSLKANKETTTTQGGTWQYTSARINSKDKLKLKYGKLEARIKLPKGKGTWSAFWMMPNDDIYGVWPRSGEIDIMEHVGSDTRMISHALHTKNNNMGSNNNWSQKAYIDDAEDVYHVYALEWIEKYYNGVDAILFYIDGVQTGIKYQTVWTKSTWEDWPFDKDFFAILNLAIGGSWGGDIDDSIFPVTMDVDWIRAYNLKVNE